MRHIVLITGLIGSGKSSVSEILRSYNYEVLDIDTIAKDTIKNELRQDFLRAFNTTDIELAKKRYFQQEYTTARKVFECSLDNYLSCRIEYLLSIKSSNEKPLFIEVPAMQQIRFANFIQPFKYCIDQVLLVQTDMELRYARLKAKGLSTAQITERLELQDEEIPVDKKLITYIKNNDTTFTLENIIKQLGLTNEN